MKKSILLTFCFCTSFSIVFGQSNQLDKKMEKAYSLVNKGEFEKADKYVEALLEENPDYGQGWDYLGKIRYKRYKDSKSADNLFGGNIVVTTKDKDGNVVKGENDSLGQKLMEILNKVKPSKLAYDKYLHTLRKATLLSTDAYHSSQTLRNVFVDEEYDTAVSKKALKYYNEAEKEFGEKNFASAAKLYQKAIEYQPDFYKAALYMGDCFYFMGNYSEAIVSFKAAIQKFPNALEPRKYLIDAYAKERLYDKALDEIIMANSVYPDQSVMFSKMEDVLYYNNKKLNITWTQRGVFPNKMVAEQEEEDVMNSTENLDSLPEKAPWTYYRKSASVLSEYCDKNGIVVKPNAPTTAKYLEVYGWEEMLKNSQDPLLNEARRMQKEGYLDCYVLVTCYHFDFYKQYADFVSKNRSRVLAYYNKFIVNAK